MTSAECVEGLFSEVRMAPVQHSCRLGVPNATKRFSKTRLTTSYLLTLRAVAGCASGSTRPHRCPVAGRASRPLPSIPSNRQHKAVVVYKQPPRHLPRDSYLLFSGVRGRVF